MAMLIIGMSFSILVGAAATMAVKLGLPGLKEADYKFYGFAISGVCFQGMALLFVHLFLREHEVSWRELFGGVDPAWRRAVGLGLLTAVVVVPFALGLNELCRLGLEWLQHEVTPQPTLQVLQMASTVPRRIFFAVSAVVLAPVVEEILFRGIAYKALRDRGRPGLALVVSSALFGLIHLSAMTFIPLTAFAVVLAMVYERTGSLLTPIAAHALFNAINLALFLFSAS